MPLHKPAPSHVLKQFDLSGKVAVVTGGVRGIGLEAARGLAEAGCDVALIYTRSTNAEEVAAAMAKETGKTIKAYQSDVTDKDGIKATIDQIAKDYGHLDIVVANAGIATHYAGLDYTAEQWQEVIAVNLNGAFYTAQAAGKIFEAQGHGNLIFTASVSALLVNVPQKQSAYNASKAGVVHLAKCLAVEWVEFARVNCVSPGFIATDSKFGYVEYSFRYFC